jgi:D-inositol-3-phosphate glycosyltransferase
MIWHYGADPATIDVIPCGVDLDLFRPLPQSEAKAYLGMPQHHKMVLFVGRIEPLKGIDVLIEAMAIALKDMNQLRDDVCLCIIGGDPDVESDEMGEEMVHLQEIRQKLGIADVVTFLGKRRQDVLPYHYSAAEVCVVPSHYESFGMVALEAMACGTPVIASRVGGLTYTVKDGRTGFLVPNDDPHALAKRIKLLLVDEDLRRDMGREATELAKRYSWSAVAGQVLASYRELTTQARLRQAGCRHDHDLSRVGLSRCE